MLRQAAKNINADVVRFERAAAIANLNDAFRRTLKGGLVGGTIGFVSLPRQTVGKVIEAIRAFDAWDNGNDPHGEHDFVCVKVDGETVFAKIDYSNPDMSGGSENPADPTKTLRLMTIMLASEY